MRHPLFLLCLGTGLTIGIGCGDSTATGGSGQGGHSQGGANAGGGTEGGGGGGIGATGPGFSCEEPTGELPALKITEVASLPGTAIQIKSAPGSPERLFLIDQDGFIRILENGELLDTPFLDVSSIIQGGTDSEEGLLGLAFHPGYAQNGRFFIHYSSAADNGASTIMEYAVSGDPLVANPNPVQLVLQHETDQSNHNGGAVEFGNDGFLYISLGDGGAQCDPGCDAMDTSRLLGKISRIDVDGAPNGEGYPAAAGNPDGAKYYHVGLRNPWRITFDACTGDLYIGDVGQNMYEEVDLVTEAAGPQNFGWPVREGMHDQPTIECGYDDSCTNPPANPTEPVAEFDHNEGCSIAGGYVYRGSAMPGLRGYYFYGDLCAGFVRVLKATGGVVVQGPTDTDVVVDQLSAFGQDGNGEVYAGSVDGTVYKIEQN